MRTAHRPVRRSRGYLGSPTKAVASAVLAVALLAVGVAAADASAPPSGGTALGAWSFKDAAAPAGYTFLGRACLTEAVPPSPRACPAFLPDDRLLTPGPVPQPTLPNYDSGWLQLTAQTTGVGWGGVAGSLLYDNPLPASAGLVVTFDQVQYGGDGADGISFFLTDGTYRLTAVGGSGGSLGYAQQGISATQPSGEINPGIAGGYLGVGLDSWGNFVRDGEARGRNCPTAAPILPAVPGTPPRPSYVALRGPGRIGQQPPPLPVGDPAYRAYPATNWVDGYCLLASTTLPANALRDTTAPAAAPDAVTTATMQRRVRVSIGPQPADQSIGPDVDVEIDFGTGSGFENVLHKQMPEAAPPTYKFGFSASTGGSSDVHLVRNVHVDTQSPLAALSVTKQVPSSGARPEGYLVGQTIPYEYVVFNTGADAVTGLDIVDPSLDASATCPTSVLAAGASTVCTGSHLVTARDLDDLLAVTPVDDPLVYSKDATAIGLVGGDPLTSPPSAAPVRLSAPRASITTTAVLDDTDHDGLADVGEIVHWTYTVVGDPSADLHDVTIEGIGSSSCDVFDLPHGSAPHVCTTTSVVSVSDAGTLSTTAWARGLDDAGTSVRTMPSSASVPVAQQVVPVANPVTTPVGGPAPAAPAPVPADAAPAPAPAVELATTGTDLRLALVAAGALVLGAAASVVSRRRRA